MEVSPYIENQKEYWHLAQIDEVDVKRISTTFNINAMLAKLIISRNLHQDLDALKQFLTPPKTLISNYDKISLPNEIKRATERIKTAIKKKEKIVINGDPDADGITGTAILVSGLRYLGAKVTYDFPTRSIEGHGLQPRILDQAKEKGSSLVITVDCGTKNSDTADYARKLGLDVIICDHHVLGKKIPQVHALINPHMITNNHEFNKLSGAAVAYKLILAVFAVCRQSMPKTLNQYLLSIAVLGTLSDRMSLLNPMNRIMVLKGVHALNNTEMEGLKALIEVSNEYSEEIRPREISRTIIPRLNAPGRIGNPMLGIPDSNMVVELLLLGLGEKNARKANSLITKLKKVLTKEQEIYEKLNPLKQAFLVDDINEKRKKITSKIEDEIDHLIKEQVNAHADRIIIIRGKEWNSGVIGIDTDRLKERFLRPAIILTSSPNNDYLRGSVRSIPSIDIYSIIDRVADDFETDTNKKLFQMKVETHLGTQYISEFGGHSQACGFSIHKDDVENFTKRIRHEMSLLPEQLFIFQYDILDTVVFSQITPEFIKKMDHLAPYGQQFEYPVFLMKKCQFGKSVKPFGNKYQKNRTPHVDFLVQEKTKKGKVNHLYAVGFGLWDKFKTIVSNAPDNYYDIIFTIESATKMSQKRNKTRIRLNVIDIRLST